MICIHQKLQGILKHMKNKTRKIIYFILIVVTLAIILGLILFNKKDKKTPKLEDHTVCEPETLVEEILATNPDLKYFKIDNAEILNENTNFRNYAFVTNNTIYIYNKEKLEQGIFEYKKVFTSNNINIMNLVPGFGADIKFIDNNDTLYTLKDNNLDNNVKDDYEMYDKAIYQLSDTLKWEYSKEFLGKKIDYDFISNYAYIKDNSLYSIIYNGNDRYPTIDNINNDFKQEKIERIYNERILKTDKNFYELMSYFDKNQNKTIVIPVKINKLSKYHDDILTFTYKYVILKDYTFLPIKDVMENRVREYIDNYFLSGFNSEEEVRYEE